MHKFTSNMGIDLIKSFEGFRRDPYHCPSGVMTIGYGHVILEHEKYDHISIEEGEEILKKDLWKIEKSVSKNITSLLFQNQFDALVSLTFNIGCGALQRSSLRQKINRESSLCDIKDEFLKWIYIKGRIAQGLLRRRSLEFEMYSKIFVGRHISGS